MRAFIYMLFGCMMLWNGCAADQPVRPSEAADVVLRNGFIYTMNEAQVEAEAVAIREGVFNVSLSRLNQRTKMMISLFLTWHFDIFLVIK